MNPTEFTAWMNAPRRTLVMGIANVTPDSFSDGGKLMEPETAAAAALEMEQSGADLIDVGGESTRPGAQPVAAEEQIRRVVPAIRAMRRRTCIAISVDTTLSRVAEAALDAGANLVNDVSAGTDDPLMLHLVARRGAPIILMHRRGTPLTMQLSPHYVDVVGEVHTILTQSILKAKESGVSAGRLLIDPGIGFGKTVEHDLALLHDLRRFTSLGCPIVVGTSRKKFIGAVIGEPDPLKRQFGTAATVAWAVTNGAGVVRVHDVEAMARVVRMTRAMMDANLGNIEKKSGNS